MKKNIHFFDQGEATTKPQVLERIGIRGRLAMELADLDLPILPGFIIDAEVGPTESDLEMLEGLDATRKPVVIVANKADKVKPSRYHARMREIRDLAGAHKIILYSSTTLVGREELAEELFG
jgi:predicted GTPase